MLGWMQCVGIKLQLVLVIVVVVGGDTELLAASRHCPVRMLEADPRRKVLGARCITITCWTSRKVPCCVGRSRWRHLAYGTVILR